MKAFTRCIVGLLFVLLTMLAVQWAGLHAEEDLVTRETLLASQSVDETTATVSNRTMARCRESAIYLEWGTGVNAGVVQIESAFSTDYAGTWGPLATITFSGTAPRADIVQITGVHGALRTRISTAVSGGTVTTRLMCN